MGCLMSINKKIKPHVPPWAKDGCVVTKIWDQEVKSGRAIGSGSYIKYTDKKGAEQTCLKFVAWDVTTQAPPKYPPFKFNQIK
jgi:hypothetical protein